MGASKDRDRWIFRAFRELPIDAFPDISNTQVQVIVTAPGMTPFERTLNVLQWKTAVVEAKMEPAPVVTRLIPLTGLMM